MKRLIPQTVDWPGPIYIRLAKGGDKVVSRDELPFEIGRAIELKSGGDVTLVTTGVTLQIALDAATRLSEEGIGAGVLHMHTVKPLDEEALMERLSNVPALVTVEEHSLIGGLGSAAAELIAESDLNLSFRRIGIPDLFPHQYGRQEDLMRIYGLTTENVMAVVKDMLGAAPKRDARAESG